MTKVPEADELLTYLVSAVQLPDEAVPTDAMVIVGYVAEPDPDDPTSTGMYFAVRAAEGNAMNQVGLLMAVAHDMLHDANPIEED